MVALLVLVPGAIYTFAFERQVGDVGVKFADRMVRIFAASAVIQAAFSGLTYVLYRELLRSGDLERGDVPWPAVEAISLFLVTVPFLLGKFVGWAHNEEKAWAKWLIGPGLQPRAWDRVWRKSAWVVRLRLKSGTWVAGVTWAQGEATLGAYVGAYPEDGDIYLPQLLDIDGKTGAFALGDDGAPQFLPNSEGLLVRWNEIEYLVLRQM